MPAEPRQTPPTASGFEHVPEPDWHIGAELLQACAAGQAKTLQQTPFVQAPVAHSLLELHPDAPCGSLYVIWSCGACPVPSSRAAKRRIPTPPSDVL